MNTFDNQRPNPFGNMNRNRTPKNYDQGGYKSWKNKDVPTKPKEVNLASFSEFPDLVQPMEKKTVFEGTSLASKLKETIIAEEEAAILKRLKKGDTPEMILREGCVSLPLKNYKQGSRGPLVVPDWVTDTSKTVVLPVFHPKSIEQFAEERKWKRLGINPTETMLFDEPESDDDCVSLPSMDEEMESEPMPNESEEFFHTIS